MLTALLISGCSNSNNKEMTVPSTSNNEKKQESISGYANVNGLKMYYEIHGTGTPLVLIHGGGSTIQTTFGRVLDSFAKNIRLLQLKCKLTDILLI